MKFIATTFDKTDGGKINDGLFRNSFIREIEKKHSLIEHYDLADIETSDAIIFFRNWRKDFVFDKTLLDLCRTKPFIVLDYAEYGPYSMYNEEYLTAWDIIGIRVDEFFNSNWTEEHHKLINHFFGCSIKVYFKRELSHAVYNSRKNLNLYPLDYFTHDMAEEIPSTEENFYKRPLDIFFNWGLSNPDRCKFHGKIMTEIETFGYNIYTSIPQYEDSLTSKMDHSILLLRSEHYERIRPSEIQKQARLVIDLFGCGMKCFRNYESAVHSISVKQDPSLLMRAFPWTDRKDCIILPTMMNRLNIDAAIDIIHEVIRGAKQHELYPIYKQSIQHVRKYNSEYYFDNHIYPILNVAFEL
jgi:hypothetical protein